MGKISVESEVRGMENLNKNLIVLGEFGGQIEILDLNKKKIGFTINLP